MGSSGGSANRLAQESADREREREARIRTGMGRIDDVFSKFDDTFFNKVRQAQLDFVVPDINTQFNRSKEQLTYALARGGQLRGTTAARRGAELADERLRALTQADSIAEQAVKTARSDVSNEKSALVGELQATGDPEAAANAAAARAQAVSIGQPLQNVGILFQNATAGLAAALRPKYDAYGVRTGGGISTNFQNRSRVVPGG